MDNMRKLTEVGFIDLYIGRDYTEIRGLVGASIALAPAPVDLRDDITKIKLCCELKYKETGRTEYSVIHDARMYRVTVSIDVVGAATYVIRQTPNQIFNVSVIGIPTNILTVIRDPKASGLILISGNLGVGKTTTAACILSERISSTSSMAVSIEDPIETMLDGRHGAGRCIQLEVNQHEGYSSALKKAMRMGMSNLLIGEIRDGDTAHEALKASLNGMFVIATIHANSIIDALERFDILSSEKNNNAKSILSKSINIVTHQTMNPVVRNNLIERHIVSIQGIHFKNEHHYQSISGKIARGDYSSLNSDIDAMRQKQLNSFGRLNENS